MKIGYTLAALSVAGMTMVGCTTAEQTAVGGAAVGAAVGAATTGRVSGALAGAAIGGAAGYLLGKTADGRCRYRAADGTTYISRCP